jgi:hypothetical protein
VAHYLFNLVNGNPAPLLEARMWGIDPREPHCDALVTGDLVLVYRGAPERELVGRAELISAFHQWTPDEAHVYPGDSSGGVLLAHVEEWEPPVPMSAVLSQLDQSQGARADFETGVVQITANEYDTAVAVAAELERD